MSEPRGLWVVRHSVASTVGVDRLVELAARYGFSRLIVQVRARGDALFASALEPQAEILKDPRYDPLAYLLTRAHRAGLEVHAWMNALFTWSGDKRPLSPLHPVNAHRDWLMVHQSGRPIAGSDYEGLYICPTRPEVQAHLWRVYTDLAQRYNVDGIHFDYIRYPGADFCYCPACQREFTLSLIGKGDASQVDAMVQGAMARWGMAWPDQPQYAAAWADFRRQQVTELVAAVYRGVKRIKPGVLISASVIPNLTDAYRVRGQDWRCWLRSGILDVVCPMAFSKDTAVVAEQIRETVAEAGGKPVWAGLGAWQISAESAAEKVQAATAAGAAGFALFSYGGITNEIADETYLRTLQTRLTAGEPKGG